MSAHRVREHKIAVVLDSSGNASQVSDPIHGEILKVFYDKNTVDAATTCVTTITKTSEQVDSYNVNTASAARYPRATVLGSSAGDNKYCPMVVSGTLTFTVSGGAVSKTFYAYVYVR